MGQINTNNYPTVNSLADADLLIVENATNGTGTTTPKQLRENAIGTATLQTSAQTVTGAINELKTAIDAGAGVICYDIDTITSGYLGQFSGSANLLLLHLTTDGIADATNGYMMMLSYSRPVARFAYGRLVDTGGAAYKQDVYADNTIICTISGSGEGTESDPVQVVILGIINAGLMLTPTAVVSDRDIIDGQGNTLSVLAEALTKTASGNPVVISDCAGGKARSLITEIAAIQDLHGLPFPYVGGAYKNKLPIRSASTVTLYGVTFTFNADGTVKANGTATDDIKINIINGSDSLGKMTLAPNTYTYSIANSLQGVTIGFMNTDKSAFILDGQTGKSKTYTVSEAVETIPVLTVSNGVTLNNVMLYPMLEIGSSKTDFAPYSNICPISGRDSVVVDDVGKNIWPFGDFTGTYSNVPFALKAGTYTVSKANSDVNCGLRFFYADGTSIAFTFFTSENVTLTADVVKINYSSASATTVNFQLERGSTATPYVPYAHSSATIQLGTTVYGADINWDTGVATLINKKVKGNTITWIDNTVEDKQRFRSSAVISDAKASQLSVSDGLSCSKFAINNAGIVHSDFDGMCIYSNKYIYVRSLTTTTLTDFETLIADADICYELATPTTIQLTPEQLEMLKGYNRVTIDNGSIELGYIAKIS